MEGNYYKYLDYYGNSSFNEVKLNEVDMLIFATLSYLPLIDIKEGILFKDYFEKLSKLDYSKYLSIMTPQSLQFVETLKKYKRYRNIRLYKMEKTINDKLQFGAMTLRFGNKTVVVYEGTNASIPGWMENFRICGQFPCPTQELGLKYLKNTIRSSDKNIYLCGHSKGGNLCLSSAYLIDDSIFDRIKKIYNFDGPGYRKQEFNSDRFKKVNRKTINYLPDGSLVGIFLENKNYRYVETEDIGFEKHNPINWHMYGQFFVHAELGATSIALKNKAESALDRLSYDEINKAMDILSDFFNENGIIHTYELSQINMEKVINMISSYRNLDDTSKTIIKEVLKYMLTTSKNKAS